MLPSIPFTESNIQSFNDALEKHQGEVNDTLKRIDAMAAIMPDILTPPAEFGGNMTLPETNNAQLPVVPAEPVEPSDGTGGGGPE